MTEELEGPALPAPPSSSEEETPAAEPKPEPITLEKAISLLSQIKSGPLLATLREPEFAIISIVAFSGFRVNNQGYSNPLVRRRLAQEATKNDKFAERLQTLADAATAMPAPAPKETIAPEPPKIVSTPVAPKVTDEMRAEREKHRRERDESRKAIANLEAQLAASDTAKKHAEQEWDALQKVSERQGQRLARVERQVTKLQHEQKTLLRLLNHDQPTASSPAPRQLFEDTTTNTNSNISETKENLWETAVQHLLNRGRHDAALLLAADVLRIDPDEPTGLQIAADAHHARGETKSAQTLMMHRFSLLMGRGDLNEGTDSLIRLLIYVNQTTDAERETRQWIASLRSESQQRLEQIRQILTHLRSASPERFTWLAGQITSLGTPSVVNTLLPQPGMLRADDQLPLDIPGRRARPMAHQLITAVETNDIESVEMAREALLALRDRDADTYQRIVNALREAAGPNAASVTPLIQLPHSPVVVDASNAAWSEQEHLVSGRPRLRSVLELRRTLWARGFFPVILYGDAPLPFTIDEPETLRAMQYRREIILVDTGVDADEVLLREAKRLHAPLVTNDYMTDWDPDNYVEKIRFAIPHTGIAQILY